jgi:hypothetical protein
VQQHEQDVECVLPVTEDAAIRVLIGHRPGGV